MNSLTVFGLRKPQAGLAQEAHLDPHRTSRGAGGDSSSSRSGRHILPVFLRREWIPPGLLLPFYTDTSLPGPGIWLFLWANSCSISVVFLGDLHKKVADQVQIGQRFSYGTAKVLRHLKNEPRRVLRCFPGPETNQQVHETLPLVGSRRHPRSQAERKRYGQWGQVAMKYQRSNW